LLDRRDPRQTVTDPEVASAINHVARAAKGGKVPMQLLDLPFLEAMALQMQAGLDANPERVPDGWKDLPPDQWLMHYRAALLRHVVRSDEFGSVDESGQSNYAAIAVNAMICHFFEQRLQGARCGECGGIKPATNPDAPAKAPGSPSEPR
jgi:hypothetical protein